MGNAHNAFRLSNPHPLVFFERDLVVAAVVKLGGARRRVIGHLLRVLKRPAVGQVIGDAGSAKRVIADLGRDAGLPGPPLDHPVGIRLPHALRSAGRPPCGPEQRSFPVGCDAGRGQVLVEHRFELVMARSFMFLAALLVQPNPAAASLREIIRDVHLQDRADPGKGIDHGADESAIAQTGECGGVDRGQTWRQVVC